MSDKQDADKAIVAAAVKQSIDLIFDSGATTVIVLYAMESSTKDDRLGFCARGSSFAAYGLASLFMQRIERATSRALDEEIYGDEDGEEK